MAREDLKKQFVREYLVDLNATQAAIRAGYSPKTAMQQGQRLLTRDDVQAAIQKEMTKRAKRTEITADAVLQRWWDIATADPNEIIHLRRVCCRHCYGTDHEYQWRDQKEYKQAVHRAKVSAMEQDKKPVIPFDAGGYGFDRRVRPSPDCPYCFGEGQQEVYAEDTRDLSSAAKLLYAGVKQTRDGFEIKMRDQDKAMENVAKHLGMFVDRKEITGKDGGPLIVQIMDDVDDDDG